MRYKRELLIYSLGITAFFLPLSEWMLSVLTIISVLAGILNIVSNGLAHHGARRYSALSLPAIWVLYLVWILCSSDTASGLHAVKLKLPLLLFPLIFYVAAPLSREEAGKILLLFIAGTVISAAAGILTSLGHMEPGIYDRREMSPFISHIRLTLMALLSIASGGYYFLSAPERKYTDYILLAGMVILVAWLALSLSITGIILSFVLAFMSAMTLLKRVNDRLARSLIIAIAVAMFVLPALYILFQVRSFYMPGRSGSELQSISTPSGNNYLNDNSRRDIENGNPVWINVCEPELRMEWNRISTIPYDSLDRKGQEIKYTLIRYLTSMGLKKDAEGVLSLTGQDRRNIEMGMTNFRFKEWSEIRVRIYEAIWQIDYYIKGGDPSGHSITQRIEFLKTAWNLFRGSMLFGTSPGDLGSGMKQQYLEDRTKLDERHRMMPHNQYMTFLASFGLAGTVIIIFLLFFPLSGSGAGRLFVPSFFIVIIFLSMFWEDTLETHTGVSFFAYFYSFFLIGVSKDNSEI